jgi:thiamine-monophosphate kinase
MPSEKEIIARYFKRSSHHAAVIHGIGDDAAILSVPAGYQLVATMDTLNEHIHFLSETSAFDIGYKAAAVNLSDLAAMGAEPKWITLSLSLPKFDENWVAEFSRGLFTVLDQFNTDLIGGDLNKGPLSITVQAEGFVPVGQALLRSGAQVDDIIYISGELGTAAVGLRVAQKKLTISERSAERALQALNQPQPQINLGLALRGIATSAIDLSDGLARDLTQICQASKVGAQLDSAKLPLDSDLLATVGQTKLIEFALTGGDDYQLCFTTPSSKTAEIAKIAQNLALTLTPIGVITRQPQITNSLITMLNFAGIAEPITSSGFEHFIT